MAYAHFFPGGTKEQYEASIAAVHPNRKTLPKGQIFHAAGPSTGGWTIVAVHDSKESWGAFPRRHSNASNEEGHHGRVRQSAPGNSDRSSQPSEITTRSVS